MWQVVEKIYGILKRKQNRTISKNQFLNITEIRISDVGGNIVKNLSKNFRSYIKCLQKNF